MWCPYSGGFDTVWEKWKRIWVVGETVCSTGGCRRLIQQEVLHSAIEHCSSKLLQQGQNNNNINNNNKTSFACLKMDTPLLDFKYCSSFLWMGKEKCQAEQEDSKQPGRQTDKPDCFPLGKEVLHRHLPSSRGQCYYWAVAWVKVQSKDWCHLCLFFFFCIDGSVIQILLYPVSAVSPHHSNNKSFLCLSLKLVPQPPF